MGHLSRRLVKILAEREMTERQAAARVGLTFETFRKILRGLTARPRDATLQQIAEGLGVPMEQLVQERALDANEEFATTFVVDDITASEALDIAIARVNELPPEEVEPLRGQLEELLRVMQKEASERQND
jgi:transcriptional regulator with XRE-family HTH domain